jgi:hypothetical protein
MGTFHEIHQKLQIEAPESFKSKNYTKKIIRYLVDKREIVSKPNTTPGLKGKQNFIFRYTKLQTKRRERKKLKESQPVVTETEQ